MCIVCKSAGRPHDGHVVASCWPLSKCEKLELSKTFSVSVDQPDQVDNDSADINEVNSLKCNVHLRKVQINASPYAFYEHIACRVLIDTGTRDHH